VKLQVNGYGADGVGDRARYVELRILNMDAVPAELEKRQPPATGGDDSGAMPDSNGTSQPETPPDSSGTGGDQR